MPPRTDGLDWRWISTVQIPEQVSDELLDMSYERAGVHIMLLIASEKSGGFLTIEDVRLIAGDLWSSVADLYETAPDGRFYHPAMLSLVKHRKRVSKARREAAMARWGAKKKTAATRKSRPSTREADTKEVWDTHLAGRKLYFGSSYREPALTPRLKKLIWEAVRNHGKAKAKEAGRGIFLSSWHTGENEEGKRYLDPALCWRMTNTVDNVQRFSDLFKEAQLAQTDHAVPREQPQSYERRH